MKLAAARRLLYERLQAAAAGPPAVVLQVTERDGVVDAEEVRRLSVRLPAAQVAVLGRSEDGYGSAGLRLAVFVVAKTRFPAPEDTLELLDLCERTLRELPGAGRKLLPVRTRALYGAELMAKSDATLWAVTATLPELAAVADATAPGGVFGAANDMLGPVLDATLGTRRLAADVRARRRGMTARHRSELLLGDELPFAFVMHAPGREVSEGSGSGQARWQDARDSQVLRQQRVRGLIAWTVTVTLWAGTDAQADTLAAEFMRRLPQEWVWLGQGSRVRVGEVTPADYSELHGASRATVEVRLRAASPSGDAVQVPLIRDVATTCRITARAAAKG